MEDTGEKWTLKGCLKIVINIGCTHKHTHTHTHSEKVTEV